MTEWQLIAFAAGVGLLGMATARLLLGDWPVAVFDAAIGFALWRFARRG
jgi:hypothetical protein